MRASTPPVPTRYCETCGAEIPRKIFAGKLDSRTRYAQRRFCSKTCVRTSKPYQPRMEFTCKHCGKQQQTPRGEKSYKGRRVFCNNICRYGEMFGKRPVNIPIKPKRKPKPRVRKKVDTMDTRICECGVTFRAHPWSAVKYCTPACLLEHL